MSDEICKRCKHYRLGFWDRIFSQEKNAKCTRPNVYGGLKGMNGKKYSFAKIERSDEYKLLPLCGKEARYWEPK